MQLVLADLAVMGLVTLLLLLVNTRPLGQPQQLTVGRLIPIGRLQIEYRETERTELLI